jgi:phage terminase large subunit-like protein
MTVETRCVIDRLREHDPSTFDDLTDEMIEELMTDWSMWARPQQLAPLSLWQTWLICAGRGFGKTRTGAEWTRQKIEHGFGRGAFVAATAADIRDVMVEGESGILAVYPRWQRPKYEPSKRRVTFHTGAIVTTYSADEPDRLRGPQHEFAWADELAAWRYDDAWDQLQFGLRLGSHPQCCVTTTPRPVKIMRELIADPDVPVSTGSTYMNVVNLAPSFLATMRKKYEGTRLGRQELHAELLEDIEGALWKRDWIERARLSAAPGEYERIVVSVDPAITSTGDEHGIIVCAKKGDHGFVIDDKSRRGSPLEWAQAAVDAFHLHKADRIIAEKNQGGDMVEQTIKTVDPTVPVKLIHASRGKSLRAEPVSALYEAAPGRVHHVGSFDQLEDQMCIWTPDSGEDSPDRLDAAVHGLTELMLGKSAPPVVIPFSTTRVSPNKVPQ